MTALSALSAPDLVDVVRGKMHRRGVTPAMLAREIGVTAEALRFVLAGQRKPGPWLRRLLECWVGRS